MRTGYGVGISTSRAANLLFVSVRWSYASRLQVDDAIVLGKATFEKIKQNLYTSIDEL